MTSTLNWLDHDPAEQERMRRILQLFEKRETVDELGIGGIRDSIADQLHPGTSTIQTRLRYFLFVPWVYQILENRRVSGSEIESEARRLLYQVRNALIRGTETLGQAERLGIIGRDAGPTLRRTPDVIYWNGLGVLEIRRYDGSLWQYHEAIDLIREARKGRRRNDNGKTLGDDGGSTWHPDIPPPPDDWLESITFALTREEALFLRERIRLSNPASLFGVLALEPRWRSYDAPWEHGSYASFPEPLQRLLDHAHRFSEAIHGAALLYNLMLARERKWEEKVEKHGAALEKWSRDLDVAWLRSWNLPEFWSLVLGYGYAISSSTRSFVQNWVELASADERSVDGPVGHGMIEDRERRLKGPRARLYNRDALNRWGGETGTHRLTYRWRQAQAYLNDLAAGLKP